MADSLSSIAAVILSGGRSSRMGADKATIEIGGRTMGEWVSRALHEALQSPVVIVLGASPIGDLGRFDDGPGVGPLSGLAGIPAATARLGIQPQAVIVLAVDHPWVRPATIEALVARFSGRPVVPLDHATRQVTCAVYSMDFVHAAAEAARRGAGFQHVLDTEPFDAVDEDEWRPWGEDGRSWFSADRPEDIETGIERYGNPGT